MDNENQSYIRVCGILKECVDFTWMNEAKGLMTLLVGVILLSSFNIDSNSAKKVVFGTGIAMAICCAVTTEVHINQVWNGEGGPPVFIPIIFGLLALWSFYVSLKKDYSE